VREFSLFSGAGGAGGMYAGGDDSLRHRDWGAVVKNSKDSIM